MTEGPLMNTPESRPSGQVPPAPSGVAGWLAVLLDAQPFAALAVDPDSGAVLAANEAARRLGLALTPMGSITDVQGGRIEADQLPRALLARAEGDGVEIDWRLPGETLSFRVYCRRLSGNSLQPAVAVLTFVDIGREKAAEAALHEALEARNEFFSVATHELKDPLFSLHLSIQLLHHAAEKQGAIPAHVRQHLEVSRRQADRLTRLIDNLLDVSRIVNGRLHLDLEAFDLCELARDMVGRVQEIARQVGSSVAVECGEPVVGSFDRLKLEQVAANLLTNAIKYGAGRPVVVRVRAEGDAAVLEVEDRGVGITPEDQQRIFHRFERVSDRHKRASLGLGLYIVRSLVQAHGGSIQVQSEPGQGATFTVRLPRTHPTGEEAAQGDQHTPSGG
jgi:signal transduction histidine kinase